jgi:hypothetical protein
MASKKWCIGMASFREEPGGSRILDIPPGAILDVTGNQAPGRMNGSELVWSEVIYRGRTAWINDRFLEDYVEKYPEEVLIPHATPEPNDAAQYMLLDGRVKYNMCGELCAAFIGGDDIDTFLSRWEAVSPGYYRWAVQGENDNPTGTDALESMLKVYGYDFPLPRFRAGLTDPIIGFRITPGRIRKMLDDYFLIASVKIDAYTGKLRGQGVGHWVVLDKIQPYGVNGGWVELYNPFPNRRQEYSYDEFIDSAGPSWGGIWVKRPPPLQPASAP